MADMSAQPTPSAPPVPPVPPEPPTRHAAARRARTPVALLAAVAIAAAAVGGGTAALLDRPAGTEPTAGSAASGTGTTVSVETDGTVASVAEAVAPSVVEISAGSSGGSGVILSADGTILTNNHVVAGSGTAEVTFHDGSTATATVTGTDPDSDLAVIEVEGVDDLKPAVLGDSSEVAVGDEVVAIGSPEGLTGTVTSGIVSALDREVTVSKENGPGGGPGGPGGQQVGAGTTTYRAIQTDAALNHGNSGGALVNMAGEIIGINSAMYGTSQDAGSSGLGFAIPVDTVRDVLGSMGTSV
ncbi:trypsin-like peptidase domain-containing protein [Streptomyces sp. MP131-18]|uniref:S1C family serine protease n=1 Tax=Streptomyces sp. MP131-18 TaxID=1857892 RepID=UPI0009A18A8C|nr:trypsin-like peptidase domain-containing protein [Streptomyces sp. MP131-18]